MTEPNRHARMIEAAVWLAAEGFADIGWAPVSDGKAPKRRWKDDKTDDPALVRKLLRPGRNALIIPKGKAAVIDIDDPAAAVALEAAGMPAGFRVQSPTPGHRHFYVRQNGTELPTRFSGGDIRRSGSGMVLGPWALRSDGTYTPNDVRVIPEVPEAVSAWLRIRPEAENAARTPADPGWHVTEGGRHGFLVSRARKLRGDGMSGERLRDELHRLNDERCRPPKSLPEVDAIAGWTNETIPDDEPAGAASPFRFYTPAELAAMTTAAPDWLVTGLVARGAITEIDGKIKAAGKTTFTLHMVRAVVDGADFLGQPTRRTRVLYVTEQSRETFMHALRLVGLADRGDELRILFREDLHGAAWAAVVAACQQDGYEIVVVDTIGKLAGIREENSAGEWAAAMTPLQDLAASGRAVVVPRHDRKGGGDVGDSGRGSSQASGDVDIILAIRRPEGNQPGNRRVIESLSRYRETPEKIVVELAADGYVLLGTDEAVAQSDARSFVSASLGREFEQNESGLSVAALVELGKEQERPVTRKAVQDALSALFDAGALTRTGRGVKGDPYVYTLARNDAAETQSTKEQNEFDDYPRSAWDPEAA